MNHITSSQNPLVKHWLKLQKDASYREEQKALLIEGKKLVEEASQKGMTLHRIHSEKANIKSLENDFILRESLISKLSSLKSPEGYFAEVKRPENASLEGLRRILVLDGLQNPGNMGTLIRTALAFGFEGIFMTPGSVDPYGPKVIRASMGASLYVPIGFGSHDQLFALAEQNKADLLIADANGTPVDRVSTKNPFMLVLGNESRGSLLKTNSSFKTVSLPIKQVDSLNVAVAGSLLMYAMGDACEN